MLHSLSAQVSYFSNLIQHNPDWIFAGIYADEVTGTTKERKDFQRLLADCRNWCCTIKVDIGNSKGQYIEKDEQEAMKDGSESTKIQHGI